MVKRRVNTDNQEEIVRTGRERWKIENKGINEQKNHGYFIEHVFSINYNAMKDHYLLAQIAHTIRQLMEKGIEIYKKYKKKLRNISADLYEIFRTRILTEQEVEKALKKCQIRFGKEDTS